MEVVNFKRVGDHQLPTPRHATDGSAGLDLYARESRVLLPGDKAMVPSGFACQIPRGYVGLLFIRSSMAVKAGVSLQNSVGVIDSDYRGEIKIPVQVNGAEKVVITGQKPIAQLVIMPAVEVIPAEVEELSETSRSEGGFGSTDKQRKGVAKSETAAWIAAEVCAAERGASSLPYIEGAIPAHLEHRGLAAWEQARHLYKRLKALDVEPETRTVVDINRAVKEVNRAYYDDCRANTTVEVSQCHGE